MLIDLASRRHAGFGPVVMGHHGPLSIAIKSARPDPASAASEFRAIDEAARLAVYVDGQLFDIDELRRQLPQGGAITNGKPTAAALILAAYKHWGEDCFAHLSGLYAVVLFDGARQVCLLARDHLGAKTLNYAQAGGRLYFASEFSPLLSLAGTVRINERALFEFIMFGDVMPPGSLFEGVHTVPMGHYLKIGGAAAQPTLVRYYDPSEAVSETTCDRLLRGGEEHFLATLDERLQHSTREHMAGGGPHAVALSGGVDSAVLTAIAARYGQVQAIHISDPHDRKLDERPMAEAVARHVGVPLSVVTTNAEQYRRELAAVTLANEIPLWHVQNLGFFLAARHASELGARTLLCGDTIGMMLSPANHFQWRSLQPSLRVAHALPRSASSFVRRLGNALAGLPQNMHGFPWAKPLQVQLVDGYARSTLQRRAEEKYAFIPSATRRTILGAKLADVHVWHSRFHYRGDRLGNAHGIEYRTPLGDVASLNLAMNVPYDFMYHRGEAKWGLKEVALRYVPRQIAYQKKIPWSMPIDFYLGLLSTPRFFEGGFCQQAFGLSGERLRERLLEWRGHELARMVHMETWGRLFAMGETVDQVNDRIAAIEAAA